MKILGIETSSTIFSLSVHEDKRLLCEIKRSRQSHSGSRDAGLFTEARQLIDEFDKGEITALAVSIGPGMFTSLRVGLSLAKGLALAKGIPMVAVNTLDVIGIPLSFTKEPVIAVINAFHQEIYAAVYEWGKRTSAYKLTTPDMVLDHFEGSAIIAGSGVDVFRKKGLAINSEKLIFLEEDFVLPSAVKVVSIALPRIKAKEFDDVEVLEPFYIKKTDAERNYNKTNAP